MRFITWVLNFNNRSVQTLNIFERIWRSEGFCKTQVFILGGAFGSVFLQISVQNNCKKCKCFKKTESFLFFFILFFTEINPNWLKRSIRFSMLHSPDKGR